MMNSIVSSADFLFQGDAISAVLEVILVVIVEIIDEITMIIGMYDVGNYRMHHQYGFECWDFKWLDIN